MACSCSKWARAISSACRAARTTGSICAPRSASARSGSSRIRRAGRRTTPRAAWIEDSSRSASGRRTSARWCSHTVVTTSLRDAGIRIVLLDIEGTTTPIAFVHDVLFPFARARVRDWLLARPFAGAEVQEIAAGLRHEYDAETAGAQSPQSSREWHLDEVVGRVYALMDQDRKSTALKLLQGKIWQEGYASGALTSDVYADVPAALARWTRAGIGVGIFSSGSVLAQQLLFRHSTAGRSHAVPSLALRHVRRTKSRERELSPDRHGSRRSCAQRALRLRRGAGARCRDGGRHADAALRPSAGRASGGCSSHHRRDVRRLLLINPQSSNRQSAIGNPQ